ncbi:2-octaprenyl-6-methoxyphenyl hydroxylase [Aeromonas molluscorum]|uniref:2-polyprenyl-6-methoxyphenol 4-hydroxylase n=1 Tax=Aeromonas molluscorum 848 TaxID=1268236 RepID=R1F5M8_9GAMM|nr:2-octaprenyl-6-methoxyphenyl hydroxylase [Aeromonas molluscorum]EOD55077.1 2-polyprenyl-6-methoxyphenol 4-hydroxylase [Aeromonas molluscorum 848]
MTHTDPTASARSSALQADITLVGGGMSGAVLALSLAALRRPDGEPLQIVLLEASVLEQGAHPGFDARAIALAAGTCEALARHGLWSGLAPHATPITDIHVSDRGHLGQTRMTAAEYGLSSLGQVIELGAAGQVLQEAIAQTINIRMLCPVQLTGVTPGEQAVELILATGEQITTSLLVAADGGHSFVRQALKIPVRRHDYGQHAVIATVQTAEHPAGRAFERFTQGGPLALLPMQHGRSSLVWSMPGDEADTVMGLDDEAFLARLQQAFGWRLGRFLRAGARHCYPLALTAADYPLGQRTVLVGNAAHLLHPIAGQGFNLGMRDLDALYHAVANAMAQGEDIGSYPVLSRYWQGRQGDQETTIWLTSALAQLFSNDHGPLVAGRNLALSLMARASCLKGPLARQTLGFVPPITKE